MNTNSTITSRNKVSIKITGNFNFNLFKIIYAISCNLSPKSIYNRETRNSIKQQRNGHRSDIKHNKNKPVAKQFNKPDYTFKNLRLAIIKKLTRQQRKVEKQILLRFYS